MNLSHYHRTPVVLNRSEVYEQKTGPKPNGLWVSVDGEMDWKAFCQGENFRTERLATRHKVTLAPDASIWYIQEPSHFNGVPAQPLLSTMPNLKFDIPWKRIAQDWQGVIIAPYQWGLRMAPGFEWYYGWDCASGCIWDLSAIDKFEVSDEAGDL